MARIAITRRELAAAELRMAAGRTKDARSARRMLAIAPELEGWTGRRFPSRTGIATMRKASPG